MKKKGIWKNLAFILSKLTTLNIWDMPNGFMTNWVTP